MKLKTASILPVGDMESAWKESVPASLDGEETIVQR